VHKKNDKSTLNKKFLEVSEPFYKKVLTRRRHKLMVDLENTLDFFSRLFYAERGKQHLPLFE